MGFLELSPFVTGIIAVALFLLLLSQGVPIAISFAVVGCAGVITYRGFDAGLSVLGSVPYAWASSPMLLPMPLFILMGYFAYHSGISRDLYDASYKWIGRLPGGIAMATTVANAFFGACTGAAIAAAATIGAIAYPEMEKLHYDRRLSTGCIAAGGTLAFLIPPSIPFILYGVLAETSVAKLFIAGIIPGVVLAAFFLITIYVMCKRNPKLGPPGPSFTWRERFVSMKGIWGMVVLFVLVIGGLYFGIFTPNEAGAIGAFGAFLICGIRRRKNLSEMMGIVVMAGKDTAKITASILMLIIGAMIFNSFLGVSGITGAFKEWINGLQMSPYVFLAWIVVIYFILGMIMDIVAILLLTIPTLAPVMVNYGFDIVWVGVLLTLLTQIGYITPPVGLNAFVVQKVTGVPLRDVFAGCTPYVVAMMVFLVMLTVFPQLALFLPGIMK